jgi:hypothetical protein
MATTAKKPSGKRTTPSKKPPESVESSQGKKRAGKAKTTKEPASKPDKGKPRKGSKKAEDKAAADSDEPRRLGIRGAAPWAARHAAKHAAEARARAAEPPPPGSARATLRVPTGAEEIKARVVELHNALIEIKGLRKNLNRNFYAIGLLLRDIRERKLYEARGFGSFETFLDREVDIGKTTSLRLARVVEVFHEEAAIGYGMDHVLQALATLESGHRQHSMQSAVGSSPPPLPLRPPVPKK